LRRAWRSPGTHCKTTTSAIAVAGAAGRRDRRLYCGRAELRDRLGFGEWVVVEAYESDRSLLKLDPKIGIHERTNAIATPPNVRSRISRRPPGADR
jgi:UDP-N-acetylmuramate-alanine ligase